MDSIPPELHEQMALAADLRARGLSWPAVAHDLGLEEQACRRWPREYPQVWQRLQGSADRAVRRETAAESINILRHLVRHNDLNISLAAIALIQKFQPKSRTRPRRATTEICDRETADFITEVRSLSDDKLHEALRQLAAQDHPAGDAAPPGTPRPE